jgi:DNA-binding IclR family transcriptional regulator
MMPASVQRGSRPSPLLIGSEIVAALVKGERTRKQLAEMVGCDTSTVWRWLKQLQASGLVYQQGIRWHWRPFGDQA